MSVSKLNIGQKTDNLGATADGTLSASEFNTVVGKINEIVDEHNGYAEDVEFLVSEIENITSQQLIAIEMDRETGELVMFVDDQNASIDLSGCEINDKGQVVLVFNM